ncbi:cytochrome P450 [Streptomyces sp. NPDC059166]|uniref:cytochrome P450 n=1 Tax=Streptomyces sp. NPDC059166 TaxID=3346752 RepID=UPI0036995A51
MVRAPDHDPALPRPFRLPGTAECGAEQVYTLLHEAGKVHRVTLPGGLEAWAVTGFDAVRRAARDRRLVHDPRRVHGARHGIPARRYPLDGVSACRNVLSADADDHVRLRGLLRPFLTPEAVARREPVVRDAVHGALDRIAQQGGGDLAAGLALPVATAAVTHLLGLPAHRADRLVGLSLLVSGSAHPDEPEMAASEAAMRKELVALVAHVRGNPGDNLTTAMVEAHRQGTISGDELLGSLSFVLFAAVDSTVAAIPTGALHLLAENGHELRLLLSEGGPDEVDGLIEDVLRLAAPFTYGALRFAAEPLELRGHRIETGDPVVLCFPAANVDPRAWSDAWRLLPDRTGRARHLSFGYGPHFCPGADLGRLQVRTALVALFRRFPRLGLAAEVGELSCRVGVARHFLSVPVLTGGPSVTAMPPGPVGSTRRVPGQEGAGGQVGASKGEA